MTTPPLPPWATRQAAGPPAPGSPPDQLLAAFIGPRWPTYRHKFTPFFEDARFVPTWNWAAALLSPAWFLYRKLYVPFVFFAVAPTVAIGMLFGGELPTQRVPSPLPGGGQVPALPADVTLVVLGVFVSTAILAGGTANFLLFRRATAAIRVVAPRSPDPEGAVALLRRIGGTSWRAVLIGLAVMILLQLMSGRAVNG
jgi:hypothetical protein